MKTEQELKQYWSNLSEKEQKQMLRFYFQQLAQRSIGARRQKYGAEGFLDILKKASKKGLKARWSKK